VLRLPNVFGKWSRPHYNSVVATFIHTILRGKKPDVVEPERVLHLLYVDDLVESLITDIKGCSGFEFERDMPIYRTTVQELCNLLLEIHTKRQVGEVLNVGSGLLRALYATYISALEPQSFTYPLSPKFDSRGSFVEVLKTPDAGQFSTFVARPGMTRGSHYHHSKVEKFLVVAGSARFRFRNLITHEYFETCVNAESPVVVESIPGWIHDVTNLGNKDLVVLVWANERFNVERPDTTPGSIE
jgi:UDP-2-acetamido-2,6-beta-L-arabino-hexul-4-ose reductase